MRKKSYPSKSTFQPIQVSKEVREMVVKINAATRIPQRHIIDMTLGEFLPKKFADALR